MIARVLKQAGLAMFAAGLVVSAAAAQSKGPFGGFKHDSKAPIEITADSLQVNQGNHTAVWLPWFTCRARSRPPRAPCT